MRIVTVSDRDVADLLPLEFLPPLSSSEPRPSGVPRLTVRIVPKDAGQPISSTSLIELLNVTQRLLDFAAHAAVHGRTAARADRRCLEPRVRRLARLRIEALDEETCSLTGVLSSGPLRNRRRTVSAHEVLVRLADTLVRLAGETAAAPACSGTLQAIDDLDALFKREARRIEYALAGLADATAGRRVTIDRNYVRAATRHRCPRRRSKGEELTGTLVSVDLVRETMQMRGADGRLVAGTFTAFLRQPMIALLGRRVRLRGTVEYLGPRPIAVFATELEAVEDRVAR
jgi:hypothetical protein